MNPAIVRSKSASETWLVIRTQLIVGVISKSFLFSSGLKGASTHLAGSVEHATTVLLLQVGFHSKRYPSVIGSNLYRSPPFSPRYRSVKLSRISSVSRYTP